MPKFSVVSLCCLLMMSGSLYAQQVQLLSANYKKITNKQSEITFSFSASIKYKAFLLKSPRRLVIDFSNTKFTNNFAFLVDAHPYFAKMRSAPRNKTDLRVVFDLKPKITRASFFLAKNKQDKKRLILRIFNNQSSDQKKTGITDKFRTDLLSENHSNLNESIVFKNDLFSKQSQLLAIEYEKTIDGHGEVNFLTTASSEYNAFLLTDPNRLVIDFKNTNLIENFSFLADETPYFERVRSALRNKQDLRMVFDFKPGIAPSRFILNKDKLNEKKIVLKLYINQPLNQINPDNNERIRKDSFSENSSNVYDNSANVLKNDTFSEPTSAPENYLKANDNKSDDNESSFFSNWELSGEISFEELGFFHDSLDSRQHNNYVSGAIEPELYREWDNGKQSFTFVPFYRYSQHDNRRTHFDIRELTWLLAEDDWELRVGFRKVFWGVAEGLHLVDIINQTDLVENTDTEDKLGQPMINLAIIRDWGTIDLFVLPGFRERTFPSVEGRLRGFPEVNVGDATYEKHGIEKHLAYAVRWSHSIGDWDIGLSHFYGTNRDPSFKLNVTPLGSLELTPHYELINQTGLDVQLTHEDWILKHEGIVRSGQGNTFYAMTTGVEYTFFDLFSSGLDLGLVVEYMYDTRGSGNALAPFQDDILTALRFALNDVQSTEILAGVMFDRTNNSRFYNIEASRRLGDSFTIDVEMRIFSGAPANDPAYVLREDDHVRMNIGYHF